MKELLKKNSVWLLCGSLCSALISYSVVFGTNVVAKQLDNLITFQTIRITDTLLVVLPAVFLASIAAFARGKFIGMYRVKVITQLQDSIVHHILKIKNEFWTNESTGGLLAKMTSDIGEIEKFTSDTLPDFIHAILSILFVAVYVGTKNIQILLLTACLYPIIILIMTYWGNILKRLAQKRKGNIDMMVEQVLDCVNGMEVVKTYNLSKIFSSKIENSLQTILNNEYKRAWIMHFSQTLQRFLFCIPNMICPLAALLLVLKGDITIGGMTAYLVLINKILSNMKQLPFLITDIKEKKVSLDRINRILNAPVRNENSKKAEAGDSIRLENVSFQYTEGNEVLHNINLCLENKKTYGFAGESGHGKSTIFKLLSGLEDEYTGNCVINKNCAIVPQHPFLFSGTIEENIGIGNANATKEDIVKAAKAAGIHEKINGLEGKYHTVIGENGTGLSGGEKQRICIARALLSDADVLLFDEPTASVDAGTEKMIAETLENLKGKKTIILISHKLSFLQNADTIFVVENGSIVEQGTHNELVKADGIYKKLWKMEARNEVQ